MMFPMVTNVEELRHLRKITRKAEQDLQSENLDFGRVEFGMMLEVPGQRIGGTALG